VRDQAAGLRIRLASYQLITLGRRSSVNYNRNAGARDDTALRLPLEITDFATERAWRVFRACLP